MTITEYESYASEIHELEGMLVKMPAERVIDRMSLEARLEIAKAAIEGIDPSSMRQADG